MSLRLRHVVPEVYIRMRVFVERCAPGLGRHFRKSAETHWSWERKECAGCNKVREEERGLKSSHGLFTAVAAGGVLGIRKLSRARDSVGSEYWDLQACPRWSLFTLYLLVSTD